MRKLRIFFGYLAFMALFITPFSHSFEWRDDVEQALKDAQEKQKASLIYFYHPVNLGEDKKVWLHPLVQKFSDRFNAIHVNIDSVDTQAVAKYQVLSFPTVVFIDPQGREIIALRMEEDRLQRTYLAARMKRVLDSIDEFQLVENQIKQSSDSYRLVFLYAKGLRDRAEFDRAEEHFSRLFEWKGLDEKTLNEVKEAYANLLFLRASRDFYAGQYDRCIDIMNRFKARYPGNEGEPQANFLIGMAFWENGNRKEAEKVLGALAKDSSAGIFQEKAKRYLAEKKAG